MTTLSNIFGGSESRLESVIISPVDVDVALNSIITLPDGVVISDFEYIVITNRWSGDSASQARAGSTFVKGVLTTGRVLTIPSSTSATSIQNHVTVLSETELKVTDNSNAFVNSIIGYKRSYATQDGSKIVAVNGGADITTNSRYEIDIATELGADYVGQNLIVQAEIYNNTGVGVADWGQLWDLE